MEFRSNFFTFYNPEHIDCAPRNDNIFFTKFGIFQTGDLQSFSYMNILNFLPKRLRESIFEHLMFFI